jgi:aspartyl-tRNA(Asn)/glutamyl-tRNA(Gln) amidotransferase subunit A
VAALVAKAAKAFSRLGAKVSEVDPRIADPREALDTLWQGHASVLLERYAPEKQALMDPGLIKAAKIGAAQSQSQYIKANQLRLEIGVALNLFFAKYDLLLTPTMPVPAFAVGHNTPRAADDVSLTWTPFTLTFNMSRHPAASVCCGLTKSGLPVGLQIVGPHYKDALVLRAAKAFEDEAGTFSPPLTA